MRKWRVTLGSQGADGNLKRIGLIAPICLVLALLANDCSAADWIKLGPTRERPEFFYDRESVKMQGKVAEVWVRRALADGAPWLLFRIDCAASTFRVSGPLPDPGAGIAPQEETNDKAATWEPISPGSTADGIWDGVCRSKKKK